MAGGSTVCETAIDMEECLAEHNGNKAEHGRERSMVQHLRGDRMGFVRFASSMDTSGSLTKKDVHASPYHTRIHIYTCACAGAIDES